MTRRHQPPLGCPGCVGGYVPDPETGELMAEPTLFDPGPATTLPPPQSADRRRTLRNKATLAAGRHPITGLRLLHPEWGYTCGDCAHLTANVAAKTYWKCELNNTAGAATDVRKSWSACSRFRIEQEAS